MNELTCMLFKRGNLISQICLVSITWLYFPWLYFLYFMFDLNVEHKFVLSMIE